MKLFFLFFNLFENFNKMQEKWIKLRILFVKIWDVLKKLIIIIMFKSVFGCIILYSYITLLFYKLKFFNVW